VKENHQNKSAKAAHKFDLSKITPMLKSAHAAIQRKKILTAERETINTKPVSWFSDNKTDSKSALANIDKEISLIDAEIGMARGLLKTIMNPASVFPIRLYQSYSINSSAGGLINSSATVDPTSISEFVSAATLFDEFRCTAVTFRFMPHGVVTIPTATTAIAVTLAHAAIAYDANDGTAAASVTELCQAQQHLLFPQTLAVANTVSTVTSFDTKPQVFVARVPKGVLQANANAVSEWQAAKAGSSYLPYGWLKTYGQSYNSVTGVIGGILEYDVEFRLRE
jgi:hypothetical protein